MAKGYKRQQKKTVNGKQQQGSGREDSGCSWKRFDMINWNHRCISISGGIEESFIAKPKCGQNNSNQMWGFSFFQ